VVRVVERVDGEVRQLVFGERTQLGLGGMGSKIEAARIACEAGEAAVIADGREAGILARIMGGEPVGTLFLPTGDRLSSYKRWIRFTGRPRGGVQIDAGARTALERKGKSLLPSGIVSVSGNFDPGDVVSIEGPGGEEFARGLTNYSRQDIERIKGCHTSRIEAILGYKYYDEVVHRDNLALLT
jgi:glutamate 5-kinase